MVEQPRSRPFSLTGAEIDLARLAFSAAGFDEKTVAEACGAPGIASLKDLPPGYALRRTVEGTPLHALVRLFVLGVPLPAAAAAAALAPLSLDRWIAGGILAAQGGSVRAAAMILPYEGLLIAFDAPGPGGALEPDHVQGPTDSARVLANVTVRRPCADALDLGCGCGFLALLAARHSDRVVASDINPRAAAYTALNAGLNGVANVEAVVGDLFAPVAGRSFDLVFSNPPFVISPPQREIYKSSGLPADGFCRRLAAEVPAFLREGGYFQMPFDWVEDPDGPAGERIRAWVQGSGCDTWVLRSTTTEPAVYARMWIGSSPAATGDEHRQLEAWLAYYREQGIRSIASGLVTMAKRAGVGWFRAFDGPEKMLGPCGAAMLDRMGAIDFLQARTDDAALMDAVLAVSPDARLTQVCRPAPEGWAQISAQVRVTQGLAYAEEVDTYVAELLAACDGDRTLRAAVDRTAASLGWEPADVPEQTADIVRQLAEEGFLVPVRR